MKVSISWLKEYIPIQMDVQALDEALTMAGLEVDSRADRYEYLDTVVVGQITHISPHPKANNLKICDVDIGNDTITVICGAPNTEKNMLTAAALPGTALLNDTMIEKTNIRGEISEGMLCSEGELALGPDFSGIMALDSTLKPGTPLAAALNLSDMVLDIDLTPNRPDCLSIIGIAREVAALEKTSVQYPTISFSKPPKGDISTITSVTIEAPDHCPRYAARMVEGITVAPSPFWLQDRLRSVGLRPINNIVDITNFVMMETGQPLHAFDFDRLEENRIVVRTASTGERFTTLDDKEHILSGDMLMICDGKKPVAVAGVMGGLNSEIEEKTQRVLIESACFSSVSIRKTSKNLGVNTDASHRFERGVDPEGTLTAVNRAAQLMVAVANGELVEGVIDEYPGKYEKKSIRLSTRDTNRLLGTCINQQDIKSFLESIEFKVAVHDDDILVVDAPTFRVDVEKPVDLMEEVARRYGYNHIPTTFPQILPERALDTTALDLRKTIKIIMKGFGFSEAVNYSFIGHQSCHLLQLPDDDTRQQAVKILNPLTDDQAVMRTTLLPGLLQTMHRNLSRQMNDFRLFEIGNIFIHKTPDDLPEEIEMMAGLWTGYRTPVSWHDTGTPCDFYDLKGVVEGIFTLLNVDGVVFSRLDPEKCWYTRPGQTAQIKVNQTEIGLIGEIHPKVGKNFDLKQKAFIFELNLHQLLPLVPDTRHANPLPIYPSVSRDMTLIVDKTQESYDILEKIRYMDEKLIESVQLFDVFEGEPVQKGKKSISFRITYRSMNKTLADDEVNLLHKNIADKVIRVYNAQLPA